ncbi:SIN1-domain-containing protein [Phellopilus nigrolimitatus]|nr:SIN1-domain-containing protein [Phellopilus nigrolimitatus]
MSYSYLIHNLRLNYLRHVDDPYGPRLISFDPRYQSNSHIAASGSADVERWPELLMPQSPQVSDDEGGSAQNGRRVHTGFPGATGLKYKQTIMGPTRMGMAGMRVTGRRAMTGKEPGRRSISAASATPRRTRADSEPTPSATVSTSTVTDGTSGSRDTYDESLIQVSKRRSAGGSSLSEIATTLIERTELENNNESQSVSNGPMALQSMSHIAAVQARRQRRRAHFSSAGDNAARPIIVSETKAKPEESSDEETGVLSGSLPDDDSIVEVEGSLDVENDDFDPDFAPPRIGITSDSFDMMNSVSNSALSTSMSSANNSSLQIATSVRGRSRLSPVSESRPSEYPPAPNGARASSGEGEMSDSTAQREASPPIESYFEIIQPPLPAKRPSEARRTSSRDPSSQRKPHSNGKAAPPADEPLFTRRKVPPVRPATSALTAKLASSNTSSNPFTELYALISGRAEVTTMDVVVFFPHAQKPVNKPLKLTVRKDATVEEVIGFSLWSYWEEGWLPVLDEGITDEHKKKERLSAVGWVLRIAEDDGEVDEDFPAPDRMGKISKFNFDAYAILEANPSQAAQNQQLEAKLVRRPSRIIVAKKKQEPVASLVPPAPAIGPSFSTLSASALGTSVGFLSTPLNISSSHGAQVLLRIRVADVDDTAVHYSTTISVYSTMYMQEVLEHICRKRKLENPKDWALLSDDFKILVPLDRTVASLEGNSQLVLVQRVSLPHYGFAIDGDRRTGRSIDPNERYTVYRKVPMLVARLERTLAIDGDYIHIMPSQTKARGVFDSGRTVSFNIKSVAGCNQSAKASASFKIIFKRDGGDKRYDFEAESARLARGLERSGTVNKIRRSRQVT